MAERDERGETSRGSTGRERGRTRPWRRIVAAVDGSPSSFDAALLASRLGQLLGCSLYLVCTMRRPERSSADPEHPSPSDRCALALASAQAAIGTKIPVVERSLRSGPAADTILAYAAEVDADLICTGKGQHRLRLGSVASSLLRRAPIPVAVVREGAINSPALCRFLVGIDGSDSADEAAALAAQLAERAGGSFSALAVASTARIPQEGLAWDADEADELRESPMGRGLVAAVERSLALGNERSGGTFLAGPVTEGLLSGLEKERADLLVLGTGRHEGAKRLLGGSAERILSRAPRPVLVVR